MGPKGGRMATVTLSGIEKRFGSTQVVHGVDLDIADGEFIVLVGPSGCGKSTLLRMIAGLEEISGGELQIDKVRANELPPQSRNISMVFQTYALYPHMSAYKNIAYGPRIRHEPSGEIASKVKRAAGILDLFDYLDRLPRQLSGGQRQRVAMGRAIVREPSVFLFDEPLSNLDAQLRAQMRIEIRSLHQRLGTTVVYVTHDQIEAMTMADRIVVLDHGRVQQAGPPLDLYDRPENLFVAGFLGSPSMNLIGGEVRHGDGTVETADGTCIPAAVGHLAEGRAVTLGVRPEGYKLTGAGDGVETVINLVEPTGADTNVYGRMAGADVSIVFHERHKLKPGDRIYLRSDPDRMHIFDAEGGHRL